jgi:hypothetical protein
MAKSLDELVRDVFGNQLMQIVTLQAQINALVAELDEAKKPKADPPVAPA